MNNDFILHTAIENYGAKNQINQLYEEMAELIIAINKYNRGIITDKRNIAEEIADVKIMLAQMELVFDCTDEVNKAKDSKLKRLAERLHLSCAEMRQK